MEQDQLSSIERAAERLPESQGFGLGETVELARRAFSRDGAAWTPGSPRASLSPRGGVPPAGAGAGTRPLLVRRRFCGLSDRHARTVLARENPGPFKDGSSPPPMGFRIVMRARSLLERILDRSRMVLHR